MLVYGDQARTQDPRRIIADLRAALATMSAAHAGLERHVAVISAFIMASELAQGLADAVFETRGADGRSAEHDAAMAVVMSLARIISTTRNPVDAPAFTTAVGEPSRASALDVLEALDLPGQITTRRAEGYAYYALYPEAYVAAAAEIAPAADTMVIGLRSIGTGLAAVVAATLNAPTPITLRPVGPPFRRELRLSPELRAEITGRRTGRFALVDEGPGLSGSSLGCVADLLEDFGVRPDRIVFFPGHDGALGAQASARHRSRWSTAARYAVSFDALVSPDRLASWAEDLIGKPIAPVEDLSGGGWRALADVDPANLAPANTLQERRKFRITTATGAWLMKFVGLGAVGEVAYRRALSLGQAGLSPEAVGLRHGFLIQRWIDSGGGGEHERGSAERRPSTSRIAAYLSFRARHFPIEEGAGASLEALFEMARTNAAEALGERRAQALDGWRSRLAALAFRIRPVETDNRLQAWEWIQAPGGSWLKTDAVDHAHAHDLIGPQDIAWDVAGAQVEFRLDDVTSAGLRTAVEVGCGRPVNAVLTSFYRPAYLAFQLGAYAMAAQSHGHWPDEQSRLSVNRDRYASALDRLLARGRPPPLSKGRT